MSFQSTMLLGVVLLGVALLVVMLHFTTPLSWHQTQILTVYDQSIFEFLSDLNVFFTF